MFADLHNEKMCRIKYFLDFGMHGMDGWEFLDRKDGTMFYKNGYLLFFPAFVEFELNRARARNSNWLSASF